MLRSIIAAAAILACSQVACAADAASAPASNPPDDEVEVDIAPSKGASAAAPPSAEIANFCFFAGTPPSDVKYSVIKNLKVGKGTYGGVKDILPKFATHAKNIGADAIINYTGSQRFGFWPWRMVRPVVRGVAVKWTDTQHRDCAALGGTTLSVILASDKPPAN